MKNFRWMSIIILVLSLTFPALTVSAAGPGQIVPSAAVSLGAFSANPVAINSELTFNLVFSVSGITPGVASADIYLSYNPALVEPPTTPGAVAVETLPDFFGAPSISDITVLPANQCPDTTNPCIHLTLAGTPQTTQTGIAARFHFVGLAEGNACFNITQSTLADADGLIIEHTSPSAQCVNIKPRKSAGMVIRQGVPAVLPNTGAGSLACSSVTASTADAQIDQVYTDKTGTFNFDNLPSGVYTFLASYPGYLDAVKTGVNLSDGLLTFDLGKTSLRGGDVNGDNVINILDITKIISMLGRTGLAVGSTDPLNCFAAQDEANDINDDGRINVSDLAIAAGNWGKTGPRSWLP